MVYNHFAMLKLITIDSLPFFLIPSNFTFTIQNIRIISGLLPIHFLALFLVLKINTGTVWRLFFAPTWRNAGKPKQTIPDSVGVPNWMLHKSFPSFSSLHRLAARWANSAVLSRCNSTLASLHLDDENDEMHIPATLPLLDKLLEQHWHKHQPLQHTMAVLIQHQVNHVFLVISTNN